MKLYRAH